MGNANKNGLHSLLFLLLDYGPLNMHRVIFTFKKLFLVKEDDVFYML